MGQIPQCTLCVKESEKEENLITSKATDFFISQTNTKSLSLIDVPILKNHNKNNLLNIPYQISHYYIVQEGFGLIYFTNKSIFKGLFHNGKPNGWGIYINPINGIYQGEYKNDKLNGYGIYEI